MSCARPVASSPPLLVVTPTPGDVTWPLANTDQSITWTWIHPIYQSPNIKWHNATMHLSPKVITSRVSCILKTTAKSAPAPGLMRVQYINHPECGQGRLTGSGACVPGPVCPVVRVTLLHRDMETSNPIVCTQEEECSHSWFLHSPVINPDRLATVYNVTV